MQWSLPHALEAKSQVQTACIQDLSLNALAVILELIRLIYQMYLQHSYIIPIKRKGYQTRGKQSTPNDMGKRKNLKASTEEALETLLTMQRA